MAKEDLIKALEHVENTLNDALKLMGDSMAQYYIESALAEIDAIKKEEV